MLWAPSTLQSSHLCSFCLYIHFHVILFLKKKNGSLNSGFSIFHPLPSLSCSAQPLLVTLSLIYFIYVLPPLWRVSTSIKGAFVCFPLCCISSTMKRVGHVVGFKKQVLLGNISACTGRPASLSHTSPWSFHLHPHSQTGRRSLQEHPHPVCS